MANILCGKTLAAKKQKSIQRNVEKITAVIGRSPCLAVVLVGDYSPSVTYVKAKQAACKNVGITSRLCKFNAQTKASDLLKTILSLNNNPEVDGILLQLPLPQGLDSFDLIEHIHPLKDVDGLSSHNLGRLVARKPLHVPCTPKGVMDLLHETGVSVTGKNAVVMGRSILVGQPLAVLLEHENATITVVHSKTINPKHICKEADILVAAIGNPGYVTADFIKPGAIVIDVGITNVAGKLKGDVDFTSVQSLASFITPVPGGVGPMTVTNLLENTVNAAKLLHEKQLSSISNFT